MVTDFGFKHLLGLSWLSMLIIVALALTLQFKKKYAKDASYDKAVIRYTCYFMWAWEIIKTIRIFNGADYGGVGNYTAYMLPFHICSMALYAYLIIGSKHSGKLSEYVKPFGFATMLLVTMIILIIPASSGILGDQNNWNFIYANLLPFQSFLYHGSLVFVSLYMNLSGFYRPKYKDIIKATVVLLVVACFAFTLNKILGVTDFMMLEFGWGNPFAFLIEKGYWLYLLILASVSIGGTAIVILTTIYIQKLVSHFQNNKEIGRGDNGEVNKEIKKFQYTSWDGKDNEIVINKRYYDNPDDFIEEEFFQNLKYIAIGLNPSDKFDIFGDLTNCKISKFIKDENGKDYMLLNLLCKLEPDSLKLEPKDYDDYCVIDEILKILEKINESCNILLFFGSNHCKKFQEENIKKMRKWLEFCKNPIRFTCEPCSKGDEYKHFVHISQHETATFVSMDDKEWIEGLIPKGIKKRRAKK